ncbi:MAG: hypothetical protein AVDCRST_MAG85-3379 [uncultured Solirubrobacteraceae bacterium]|uniref:Uncharacterized protein n=1 Tax=uncultured Solirubrobacteraceae bacterium TaxID=1162706 RepID=A0A6J4TMY3_9ACTN|nr:MAG: hypothetical protein AVDCRST_MAG85-3379 [uncultured Solirubrobacteraceae bacterium]
MGGEIFVWIMVGIFGLLFVMVILLGIFYPGSGAGQLDWKPTRSPEVEAQNEVDDIAQMLAATNAKRRRRGEKDLTEEGMNARVHEELRLQAEMRDRTVLDSEMVQLLDARNERRRKRGLPEMTLDEFRASLDVPPPRAQS